MGLERHMHDDVTHWPVSGSDGFGGFAFGTPVKIKGRWEDKNILFLALTGEEEVSNAIVYTPTQIPNGDYLAKGDFVVTADPTTIDGTFRVRASNRSTDLAAMRAINKAVL